MKHLLFAASILAASAMGAGAAAAQNAPLTIDDSLTCAGIFFTQSQLPENAAYPEGVENYRQMTKVFLDRAGILAGRTGESTEDHIERAASITSMLLGEVDAAEGASARYAVILSWQPAEDECIAGGRVAP